MNDKNSDFQYCKGIGCPLRDRCVRYVEGATLPEGNWWWQLSCDEEERPNYLPTTK